MPNSKIEIDIQLNADKIPDTIQWFATSSTAAEKQEAKAMLLSLWDGKDKSALRIDLWTDKMMVDEMADFYYQTLIGLADTFNRATKETALANEFKEFAKRFLEKFNQIQKNNI